MTGKRVANDINQVENICWLYLFRTHKVLNSSTQFLYFNLNYPRSPKSPDLGVLCLGSPTRLGTR